MYQGSRKLDRVGIIYTITITVNPKDIAKVVMEAKVVNFEALGKTVNISLSSQNNIKTYKTQ